MRIEIAVLLLFAGSVTLAAGPAMNGPAQPAGQILELHAFRSDTPIPFHTIRGLTEASAGFVAVLEVDRQRLVLSDHAAPVLLVGETAARVVNLGRRAGRMVVLLPAVELATTPIYFGPARALRFITPEMLSQTRPVGGVPVALPPLNDAWHVADMGELYRRAAVLVLRFAPEERSAAEMYLGAQLQ
jgi:hypothetical protein